ncbi:MAG: hypothetical protein LBI54_08485, partial [Lachnospiraceae bacterium]|nr:hypothetical protein [Lachnospiraceae bacterium]
DSQYDIHIIPPGGDAEPPLIAEDDTPPHLATDIAKIHVLHGAMQFNIGEYVIDFENKEFWQYDGDFFIGETNELSTRDVAAENEGYEYGGKLDDDKIATFFEQCDQYGFTAWDENYDDIMLADGHRWYVLITYADGSEQVARGSNDYPATYDDMTGAFMDLTGEDVLLR